MRYTEESHDNEIKDLFDLIRIAFTSVVFAPYRLFSEISTKVMFLDRSVIERTLIVAAVMDLLVLISYVVKFAVWGSISLMSGVIPVVALGVVLGAVTCLAWVVSQKFEGLGNEDLTEDYLEDEEYDTEIEGPTVQEKQPEPVIPQEPVISQPPTERNLPRAATISLDEDDDFEALLSNSNDLNDIDLESFFTDTVVSNASEDDRDMLREMLAAELALNKVPTESLEDRIRKACEPEINFVDNYEEDLLK